nr:thylakoid lumenal 15.0 kDa protein 2, chloroplastic [Ipomoea batatas]
MQRRSQKFAGESCVKVKRSMKVLKDVCFCSFNCKKKGCFSVVAVGGAGEPKKFFIGLEYLSYPPFLELLEAAEKEFGFEQQGVGFAEGKVGVNKPEMLPKEFTTVIDVAGFLSDGQEKRLAQEIADIEKDTGFKLRVLAQNYPETPGLAIRDFWKVDDRTIVFVADPTFGNILNFNVGASVDLDIPRSFWSRLAGKYGNIFYWKEKGEDASIESAVMAISACLREPVGANNCSEVQKNGVGAKYMDNTVRFGSCLTNRDADKYRVGVVQQSSVMLPPERSGVIHNMSIVAGPGLTRCFSQCSTKVAAKGCDFVLDFGASSGVCAEWIRTAVSGREAVKPGDSSKLSTLSSLAGCAVWRDIFCSVMRKKIVMRRKGITERMYGVSEELFVEDTQQADKGVCSRGDIVVLAGRIVDVPRVVAGTVKIGFCLCKLKEKANIRGGPGIEGEDKSVEAPVIGFPIVVGGVFAWVVVHAGIEGAQRGASLSSVGGVLHLCAE